MTRRLPRLSIRTRLTLWYSSLVLLILALGGTVSYALLRKNVMQDADASLLTVAQVLSDTVEPTTGTLMAPHSEAVLRGILGPEFHDKFVRLLDPQGTPRATPAWPSSAAFSLSEKARMRAARGTWTYETIEVAGDRVRLLTMPVLHDDQLAHFLQVGVSLQRAQQTLRLYAETLAALIPLGVVLAGLGGALLARSALAPVHAMARTARDITAQDLSRRIPQQGSGDELDYLADTLNAMLAHLENAFGQIRRFAADAAHELRTPLTALRGGIEVALRSPRSRDDYRQVLRSSLEEVERLIRLAEELLMLSRAAAHPEKPNASVDLEALLLDVLDAGMELATGTGASVSLGAVAPALTRGDTFALRRAVLNLVENAVKYTPAGGHVELSLMQGDGQALLTVEDDGLGIDPADVERVFEPFVRLDAARAGHTGGAGLGLAIARAILQAHGGDISLAAASGGGCRFTVRLPLAP